jgi:hypothetical protein
MKRSINSTILGIFLLLWSCRKEPDSYLDFSGYRGEIVGIRDGKNWIAPKLKISYISYCNPFKKEKVELTIITNTPFTDYLEWVSILHIPTKVGKYTIEKDGYKPNCDKVFSNCTWMHYDQSDARYEPIELNNKPNQVTVTAIDTASNTIKGNFELSLIVSYKYYKTFPDTIQLSGTFRSPISLPYK